jgi:membrane-associated protease RseP (regulator of RpoE activity)
MNRLRYSLVWVAGLAALSVLLIMAGGTAVALGQTSVQVQAQSSDNPQPEFHIWINGKEVRPGEPIELGPGSGSLRMEARGGAADKAETADEAFLGIMMRPLEGKAKEEVAGQKGVVVGDVLPESPAAKAGIQAGDIITQLDREDRSDLADVESPEQLVARVRQFKPGTNIKVIFYRGGKLMEKTVTLGSVPGLSELRPSPVQPKEVTTGEGFLGVSAAPLTAEMMEIAGTDHGALINSLPDESPAAKAGLLPGDVITTIDGKDVNSPTDLVATVRPHKPGDVLKVTYYRMGKKRTADVKLGKRPAEEPNMERLRPFPITPGMKPGDLPEELRKNLPELRQYLDQLNRDMEGRGQRLRPTPPGTTPPGTTTPEPGRTPMMTEPYGVGKDIGKILERLDQINQRLDQIEKRLDQLEKKK